MVMYPFSTTIRTLWRKMLPSPYPFGSRGENVQIEKGVLIHHAERIEIGRYVHLGWACYLNGRGGLRIGSYSILGPEVAILTAQHNYLYSDMIPYDQKEILDPVVIEEGVWIGMRAMILPGVTLGKGCVVGAGAVVAKSFQAGSVIVGNPARVVRVRDMEKYRELAERGQYYLLLKKELDLKKEEVPALGSDRNE